MAHILVVDDEPDVRELFNITLKMAGHITDTAHDGREAVDKLAVDTPDLILLDLMMPRMDGFEFLSHIRLEMDNKPMRVLVATAKTLEESDHKKLSDWPVVGVLNKGDLDIVQMVKVIGSALNRNPHRTNGNDTSAKVPKPEEKTGALPASGSGEKASSAAQPAIGKPAPETPGNSGNGAPPATDLASKTANGKTAPPAAGQTGPPPAKTSNATRG